MYFNIFAWRSQVVFYNTKKRVSIIYHPLLTLESYLYFLKVPRPVNREIIIIKVVFRVKLTCHFSGRSWLVIQRLSVNLRAQVSVDILPINFEFLSAKDFTGRNSSYECRDKLAACQTNSTRYLWTRCLKKKQRLLPNFLTVRYQPSYRRNMVPQEDQTVNI